MSRSRLINIVVALSVALFFTASHAAVYKMPEKGNDMVGENFTIKAKRGDTLMKIARRYDMSLHEMLEANRQVRHNRIRIGQDIIIPSRFILPKYRKGIVINLPELRLYFFTPDGRYVYTFPVGVGRSEWRTPPTKTYVYRKKEYPEWNVPKSIKEYTLRKYGRVLPDIVPGGVPDNPLGDYAIYLAKRGILIHGTNAPNSIGKYVSSGCIRLYPRNIEQLFFMVKKSMPVYILNHPHKVGMYKGELYLESQEPVKFPDREPDEYNHDDAAYAIHDKTKDTSDIDWRQVQKVARNRTGIPEQVSRDD